MVFQISINDLYKNNSIREHLFPEDIKYVLPEKDEPLEWHKLDSEKVEEFCKEFDCSDSMEDYALGIWKMPADIFLQKLEAYCMKCIEKLGNYIKSESESMTSLVSKLVPIVLRGGNDAPIFALREGSYHDILNIFHMLDCMRANNKQMSTVYFTGIFS